MVIRRRVRSYPAETVETPFGDLIEVTDREEPGVMPLDEVADAIRAMLLEEREITAFEEYVDGLKAEATIVYGDGVENGASEKAAG